MGCIEASEGERTSEFLAPANSPAALAAKY